MADFLNAEKRSWNMSRIKSKNTKIELAVRKYLFAKGYRYRLHVRNLPGKPDIVLKKYKTVIFVHGCFWHRHAGCRDATTPKTRLDFWENKFQVNAKNDRRNTELLEQMGWQVIIVWECQINGRFEETMSTLIKQLDLRGVLI
ncbi:MAG TPA: very short patch repair endonuclease [Negativicutes bacterium]|nr:very short patch repair endonuclease [Clostridia bacterium]HWR31874.1 very short patch repair endonuclease [Negativicutes bacterium]